MKNLMDRYFIVRSSGLYGIAGSSGKGGNFMELMLRLAHEGKPIRVVADQVLSPTYTVDLAQKISELITTHRYGTYHITNCGQCSWYYFARKIFELSGRRPDLSPTTTATFGARAARPPYLVLKNATLAEAELDLLRPSHEALAAYLRERNQRK